MGCPATGPCEPYVDVLDLCCVVSGGFPDPCVVEGQPIDPLKIEGAIQAASELMWAATGRQFGKCTVKIRPCQQGGGCNPCPDGGSLPFFGNGDFGFGFGSSFPWYPQFLNGVWTNISCPACPGQCGCNKLCEINLPYPVCCVNEVKVDGAVLSRNMYRVDDFRKLVRIGGQIPYRQLLSGSFVSGATITSPSGEVVVTGGATVVSGGIGLPTPGNYNINLFSGTTPLADQRCGVMLELEGDVTGFSFNWLGSGAFEVDSISGEATITKVGSLVTVGPTTVANTPSRIRLRAINSCMVESQIQVNTGVTTLTLTAVQWDSDTEFQPCHGEQVTIDGALIVQDGTTPYAFNVVGPNIFNITSDNFDTPGSIIEWPVHTDPYVTGDIIMSQVAPNGARARLVVTSVVGAKGPHIDNETDITVDAGTEVGFTLELLCSVPADAPCWPNCQLLELEDTEVGTFSVTVTYGREVPFLVSQATAELACQFLKACVGAPCQLPQRISSISRQGVTVGFLDTMSFLEKGRTGIYLVDLAINTFNPYRLLKNASVYSIDAHPKWRRTDTGRDC